MIVPGYNIDHVLHETTSRRILRARRQTDGASVVLKTLRAHRSGRADVVALKREYRTAQPLRDRDGVVGVYAMPPDTEGNPAIEMDPAGRGLAMLLAEQGPLGIDRFLGLAMAATRALAAVHEADVIHKDVNPRHLLVDESDDSVRLTDFAIAATLSRERQAAAMAGRLEGSLAQMSPEQTGRINRDVDYRTDYYSLGVTFFEMLTGTLPFSATDALEWVHSHISVQPADVRDVAPTVPEGLAAIVAKLLAKTPWDRYQSPHGLLADLAHCRDEYDRSGTVPTFRLATKDVSRRFAIPQTLYGREPELDYLMDLFTAVCGGATKLCLVSGYSGVGKSALVKEITEPLVRAGGHLIQGKIDQFQERAAFGAVAQALGDLVTQVLAEPAARLDAWRRAILNATAPNTRLLTDMVPELDRVVGEQPPVSDLGPTEARHRLQIVLANFIRVFATADHPLVIFLDDLQWADSPTLELIQTLVTARDMGHLLILGAYRSNEVDVAHPLRLKLDAIRKHRPIDEVTVRPLPGEAVTRLLVDTLSSDSASVAPLAAFCQETTGGNPFFLTELLYHLHREGCIWFSAQAGGWTWDMDAVRRAGVSSSVVDFMVDTLRQLPAANQDALQLAACIGNRFDLRTLATILAEPMAAASDALFPALQRNIVLPVDRDYKYATAESGGTANETAFNPTYAFAHDRVQQAAYALIDDDRRQALHRTIGRLIRDSIRAEARESRVMAFVGHLNAGRRLIDDPLERRALAQYNLAAGLKAQAAAAYGAALDYLTIGRELLPPDAWQTLYPLAKDLGEAYQQCLYLTGHHDAAAAEIEALLDRVETHREKAEVLSTRTRQLSTLGRMQASIETALQGLNLLGLAVPDAPDDADVERERMRVTENRGDRAIADLVNDPALTDPDMKVAIRLLMEIFPAAFLSGSGKLFPVLVLKSVNLSLRHGASPEASFAYAAYGMVLAGGFDDPAHAYAYGRLGVAMNERFDDLSLRSRIIYVYAMFIQHWNEHWSEMTPWFRKGIEAGYQSGDLLYLAYSAQDCIIWDPTLDLETAYQEHAGYIEIVRETGYQDSLDSATLFLQLQKNFLGWTGERTSMNDDDFDEAACLAGMRERSFMTGVANYHIYKAEIGFFYAAYELALHHVRAQDELLNSVMSLPQSVRFRLIAFLTRAAVYPAMDSATAKHAARRMREDLAQMRRWAANFAPNYRHLQLLMEAEQARLDGDDLTAMERYDASADQARKHQFMRDEAMANELAGRFFLTRGRGRAAEGYLRAARRLYVHWGAHRKVTWLDEQYPWLAELAGARGRGGGSTALDTRALDMTSVMKASRAISGEIEQDRLLRTTVRILLENAGGRHGCFVVAGTAGLTVEAAGTLAEGEQRDAQPFTGCGADGQAGLPTSVIHQVLRTHQPLVFDDLSDDARFAGDPYVARNQPRAVMCVPVQGHAGVQAAIYLENDLAPGVFTQDRVEVIKLLASQAAVSLENARLYAGMEREVAERTRELEAKSAELERTNTALMSSITYASLLQSALLPDPDTFDVLAEHFVLWWPRDVVGGDIYVARRTADGLVAGVIDCTGHGVPGAFMTMAAYAAFDNALETRGGASPGRILAAMNQYMRAVLTRTGETAVDDGLEMGLVTWVPDAGELLFAGGGFDLMAVDAQAAGGDRDAAVARIRGERVSLGDTRSRPDHVFTDQRVAVTPGRSFHMASDGIMDQVGGPKRLAFGRRRLRRLLAANADATLEAQREAMTQAIQDWQGNEQQRDDITLMSLRPLAMPASTAGGNAGVPGSATARRT